ncbi:MAG TPA: phage major capsid protein [Candidatus Competibacter phosphatis]|nr:phage major capsid protein [Candidatus Competibacter phosphatis]
MSKTRVIELRQKRAKLIADARALLEAAGDRALTQEEQNNWDAMMNQADSLKATIDREERQLAQEAELGEATATASRPDPASTGSAGERGQQQRIEFRSRGMASVSSADPGWQESREWRRLLRTTAPAYQQWFTGYLRDGAIAPEMRALQADLDSQGGYLVAPMQMVDQILRNIDDMVFLRRNATVFSVPNADSLGVPTLENDPADADWTTELATGNEDSTMSFGRRELHPHPLAKRIKMSRKLLMKVPSVDDFTVGRLAYKFGITQEKAFLTGSGAGQPLGIFTASSDGVPTSRDVSTGNTTTDVTFDGLIEAKYSLKQQYWARAQWLGHRDFYKMVAKLKDGDGQYLWRESTRVGEPDRLLGQPAMMSEYAPNTFTTGLYVAAFFDPSQYWIADSMSMEVQRLVELYAETNQVGLIGRLDSDGQPVLAEAFARVKLA